MEQAGRNVVSARGARRVDIKRIGHAGAIAHIRENQRRERRIKIRAGETAVALGVGIHDEAKTDLTEVAGALHTVGLLTGAVERREQNRDEQRDDPNDHQQLDEGKPSAARRKLHNEAPFNCAARDLRQLPANIGWMNGLPFAASAARQMMPRSSAAE